MAAIATPEDAPAPARPAERPGLAFWVTAVVGAAIVLFGIRGLLENEPRGAASAIRWFVGGALVVDLIVVPLGAAIGWAGRRVLPPWAWPAVRAGLLATAVLVIFALPLVLDQGGTPGNPTVRPRDYETGLLVAVASTWAVVAAVLAIGRARGRRTWQHAADADRGGRPDR